MSWINHALHACINFFKNLKGRKKRPDTIIVNETGNIILQVASNTDPNTLSPRLWQGAFGHFALALKMLGAHATDYDIVSGYLERCPWFNASGQPIQFRHKIKYRDINQHLARVMYSDCNNPSHQDKAQRLLMTMTTRALKPTSSSLTSHARLTILLLKCQYKNGQSSSHIYAYSFDLELLRKTHSLLGHQEVEIDVREEQFTFQPSALTSSKSYQAPLR